MVEALVKVKLAMVPLVDQKFVMVPFVVEALLNVEFPETVRLLREVSPVTASVPPMVALPRMAALVVTERELRVAPDLTVNDPLISALLAKCK